MWPDADLPSVNFDSHNLFFVRDKNFLSAIILYYCDILY